MITRIFFGQTQLTRKVGLLLIVSFLLWLGLVGLSKAKPAFDDVSRFSALVTTATEAWQIQSPPIISDVIPNAPLPDVFGKIPDPDDLKTQSIEDPIPTSGNQKLLVILVDFSDRPGIFTGQQWRNFFFGLGGFSDYYREVSYNQLNYSGDVVGLQNGLPVVNSNSVAYIRLSQPLSYYANGQSGNGAYPQNTRVMVYEALFLLNSAGFNFAPYADVQGRVRNLVVVFAGGNAVEPGNNASNALQPTADSLKYNPSPFNVFNGTGGQIIEYTLCPERRGPAMNNDLATIGVCTHEHGHGLGMVDLYDLSLNVQGVRNTQGVGFYDLMAYGAFGADSTGLRPFHPGPFSKEFFNWVAFSETPVPPGVYDYTFPPAQIVTNNVVGMLKLYPRGDPNSSEYFLLENRQPVGFDTDWEERGLCRGLLIWHVDKTIAFNDTYRLNNTVNSPFPIPGRPIPSHQGVILVEADGRYDLIRPGSNNFGQCSDTWQPGRLWNANSTPGSRLWDGGDSQLSILVKSQNSDGSIDLRIGVGAVDLLPNKTYLPLILR